MPDLNDERLLKENHCFRRAQCLIAYWKNDRIVVHNYATEVVTEITADDLVFLDQLGRWVSFDQARQIMSVDSTEVFGDRMSFLLLRTLVQSSGQEQPAEERLLFQWQDWLPAAAFFHRATRITEAKSNPPSGLVLRRIAAEPPLKSTADTSDADAFISLPDFSEEGPLAGVLSRRRTWRRFGSDPVQLNQVSTLLGSTWAARGWVSGGEGRFALKSSPSGGGKHSIEAYLMANNVSGLEPGLYHYSPDKHGLSKMGENQGVELREEWQATPKSWFLDAAAVVFMTSVFARVQWRYATPRAYRVILLEAGHLAQTFCLVAESLALAPFCTAAIVDKKIEEAIGIDGVTESVLYAVGVGTRPQGVSWAPLADRGALPTVSKPAYAQRFQGEVDKRDDEGET